MNHINLLNSLQIPTIMRNLLREEHSIAFWMHLQGL